MPTYAPASCRLVPTTTMPIPSSKIVLPTHKLSIYPPIKHTTNMFPYPKTQQKTTTHKEVVSAQRTTV